MLDNVENIQSFDEVITIPLKQTKIHYSDLKGKGDTSTK